MAHRARRLWMLGLLIPALAAGCAGSAPPRTPPNPFGQESGGQVFLEVRNELEEDVLVRLRSGSVQQELGSVPPRTVTRLTFPWSDFGRVTFQIEPTSGSRYSLPAAEVRPGDSLELTIQDPVSRSRLRR